MSHTKLETTWADAKFFKVFRHPIPGTYGVAAMRAHATLAENAEPNPNTTYIGFNERRTMLLIFYVRSDGRVDITKSYVKGRNMRFDIDTVLTSTARMTLHGRAALERLLNHAVTP